MATLSQSPRVCAADPTTPLHSPSHSVYSSASSRLSVRNLTLHEYRKQQNSPASHATPPGKTLRRKAAACGLKETERTLSASSTPLSLSRVPPRPLHISQSTHSLFTYQRLPPSPPHQDHVSTDALFRSQSAEPSRQSDPAAKTREFKPIKRLPKPLASSGRGPLPISPTPLASMSSNQSRLSPLQTTSSASFDDATGMEDSLPTPSSFSLSRFPQPPNFINPSLSPPAEEDESPRLNTVSYNSTAPVTPPATPAVIHYRGASFDLVNPHNSLVLDNIVTPSRDLDSSEHLPLRSSDNLLSSEMAHKRPLYGDLPSAYKSIQSKRGDSTPPHLDLQLPLPPAPLAHSPESYEFDPLTMSPESYVTASPPTIQKAAIERRFSLKNFVPKNLARSFAHRFSKDRDPEKAQEQELKEFFEAHASPASASFDGEFPRPLEQSYQAVRRRSSTFSDEPSTPISPLDEAVRIMGQQSVSASVEHPGHPTNRMSPAPLTSMVPDSPREQRAGVEEGRPLTSEPGLTTKPYYDDFDSIYPSSSVYTGDSRRQSKVPSNLPGNRKSDPYYADIGIGADALAEEFRSDALLPYPSSQRTSRRMSKPLEQAMFHRSINAEREKTDTISKFIDQYKGHGELGASQPHLHENIAYGIDHQPAPSELYGNSARLRPDSIAASSTGCTSSHNHFPFDMIESELVSDEQVVVPPVENGRAVFATHPGEPPSIPAPLAPAFRYDEDFESAEPFSPSESSDKSPSYGDMRQLLGFSTPIIDHTDTVHPMPSSSYSQPSAALTPTEVFDRTLDAWANTGAQEESELIPAMWSRSMSSHNLTRIASHDAQDREQDHQGAEESSELIGYEDEDPEDPTDWETLDHGSPRREVRVSLGESLANYSSSDESHTSRDSMGFSTTFPGYEESRLPSGTVQYRHPDRLRDHSSPFNSSPPQLSVGSLGTVRSGTGSPFKPGPSGSPIVPALHGRSSYDPYNIPSPCTSSTTPPHYEGNMSGPDEDVTPPRQILPFTPWATPYEMSEKLTQELLASGPNDDILYEQGKEDPRQDSSERSDNTEFIQPKLATMPGASAINAAKNDADAVQERENSFAKLTVVGPKGNLTGTPHGTGMHDAGSSLADNSSPGAILSSSPLASPAKETTGYRIFQAAAARNAKSRPENRNSFRISASNSRSGGCEGRGSVNRDKPLIYTPPDRSRRISSHADIHSESPFAEPDNRVNGPSVQPPVTPQDQRRRGSRVYGQTKLRQMVLAPSASSPSASDRSVHGNAHRSLNGARIHGTDHSARPSTSSTHTPLRRPANRMTLPIAIPNKHSPHLLCPERAMDPVEEEARLKLSWVIFAIFCILPPVLILYRWMGDSVIVNLTQGRFRHVSPKPKSLALGVGIFINIGIVAVILLPILIAHAAGML